MISDKLYELAFKFRKTKLWDILRRGSFFAVKLSDGRMGYIRLIRDGGSNGPQRNIYALELYIGEEGLDSLRTMIKAERLQLEPLEYQESPLLQSCLQCVMVGKVALSEEEQEEAKAFAHSHGIRISGKNAYPLFMKLQPYYYPWRLREEKDQEALCEALAAAIEISRLLEEKTPKDLGLMEVQSNTKEVVLLEWQEDRYVLGKMELLPEKERKWPTPEICNDISIAKLKKVRRSGIWECGFIRITTPVEDEKGEIPVFPIILFAANSDTGYLLPVSPITHYEENPDELMNIFMEALLKEHICPGEIRVKDSRAYAFFQPFCERLKIAIKEEAYLPALEEAEAAFYSDFGLEDCAETDKDFNTGNGIEDAENLDWDMEEAIQSLEELLDMFMELNEKVPFEFPKDVLKQLMALLANGNLPKGLEDKITRLMDIVGIEEIKVGSTKSENNGRPKLESVSSKMAKEAEGKSYVISVSLRTGCYRHIQISCNDFLSDLHLAIIKAFGFDNDHAHAFFMDNEVWSDWDCYFAKEAADDFKTTNRYRLSQTGLREGMKFKYLFDFGDEWRFQCKVLKIIEKVTEEPIVIKVKGEAPEQYPDWGDDWDDE